MRRIVLPIVLMLGAASPALANEALDRFEAASETISTTLYALTAQENPGVFKTLPEADWDEAHRQAGTCVLVGIAEQAGGTAMSQYIVALEEVAKGDYAASADLIGKLSFEVPGLSAQSVQLISQACGMTDLQAARLQAAM